LKDEGTNIGEITEINGPIITVEGFENHCIGDMVEIGKKMNLIGEIIKIYEEYTIVQCYEETEGLKLFDTVKNLKYPLSMELGPGLLNSIYDGIQRPLEKMEEISGSFISRGIKADSLSREKKWDYKAIIDEGEKVSGGDVVGKVEEYHIVHKIMVPFGNSGKLIQNNDKTQTIDETAVVIQTDDNEEKEFNLYQRWPIRKARPIRERYLPKKPLITGLRVFDFLYPVAKGGVVAVPGGFGTGKTVVQHSLAKFSDATIIVYIGCGERGNEMADLINEFPKLKDPVHDRPLMERTILIANTSNMPVSAREASIYSGITMAEYWRDQGYNVLLLADSTSRWAEALREISGRLEEMPTEGGYPAYLSDRLSSFYERAGYIMAQSSQERYGSVTAVGAVSPPGGDFSEPVTKNTKRFIKAFWALDADLAYARHYPAVSWNKSYSDYVENVKNYWHDNIDEDWRFNRDRTQYLLSRADELENISQLVGKENLPADQQLDLFAAELIKEGFLIQNAFNEIDRYSSPEKTSKIISIILKFYNESMYFIENKVPFQRIEELECVNDIKRMRLDIANENIEKFDHVIENIAKSLNSLRQQYRDYLSQRSRVNTVK